MHVIIKSIMGTIGLVKFVVPKAVDLEENLES
jgi:hypothetical protein